MRSLLEAGFRKKTIQVLCCTSTLSAGVNLPARRVIFLSCNGWFGSSRASDGDAAAAGTAIEGAAAGAASGMGAGGNSDKTFIGVNQYRQMAGRAGRAGMTDEGESVLVVHSDAERHRAEKLLGMGAECLRSCFLSDDSVCPIRVPTPHKPQTLSG